MYWCNQAIATSFKKYKTALHEIKESYKHSRSCVNKMQLIPVTNRRSPHKGAQSPGLYKRGGVECAPHMDMENAYIPALKCSDTSKALMKFNVVNNSLVRVYQQQNTECVPDFLTASRGLQHPSVRDEFSQ